MNSQSSPPLHERYDSSTGERCFGDHLLNAGHLDAMEAVSHARCHVHLRHPRGYCSGAMMLGTGLPRVYTVDKCMVFAYT